MAFQETATAKHITYRLTSIGEGHHRKDILHHGGQYYAHTQSPRRSRIQAIPFCWQSEKLLYPI